MERRAAQARARGRSGGQSKDQQNEVAPAPAEDSLSLVIAERLRHLQDSGSALNPTADRIAQAARRVLLSRGYHGLSLNAVADEAGVNKALLRYYFKNKKGLVEALVDRIVNTEAATVLAHLEQSVPKDRLSKFASEMQTLLLDTSSFRVLEELIPVALEDDDVRQRLARMYDFYVDMELVWLGLNPLRHPERATELVGLAELVLAVEDGLSLQKIIRGSDFDPSRSLHILGQLLSSAWTFFAPFYEYDHDPWAKDDVAAVESSDGES